MVGLGRVVATFIMSSGTSTLNPYADSYVPISKREVNNEDKDSKTVPREAPAVSDFHPTTVDDYKLKGQQVDASDVVVSSEHSHETESKFVDEESEMDLAYLQMVFPGVSDQSLADVYNFNRGDLESAMDMLTDLESGDNPSHSLGIEQPEEPVSSGESSSVNTVNVTGESSSACPTVSAVAT
ncbi:Polyadenylate-binding protein-interacting protein 6 [Bienertia sinuspersici]